MQSGAMGDQALELQRAVLEYMDKGHLIETIVERCRFYQSLQDQAFCFTVPIQPCDLLETNVTLGNMVLNQPTAATRIFQEVVYVAVSSLCLLPQCQEPSQVIVALKLLSLPNFPEYRVNSTVEFFKQASCKRFVQYEGIVCGKSTVHKYTKMARFLCGNKDCTESKGNKYIRLHIAGARETQTIRSDFVCPSCDSQLREDVSSRVLADKLVVQLMDIGAYTHGLGIRFQGLTAYIRDDMVLGVEIGMRLVAIGIPILDLNEGHTALEVNSIQTSNYIQNVTLPTQPNQESNLPATIRKLRLDRKGSPWGFTLSLAYAFGGDVTPAGCYLHLKLGLLLSLVGSSRKDPGGLDILAVGNDTLLLHRLLHGAAGLASRRVVHHSTNPLAATVGKLRHGTQVPFIDGGSLLVALDGVCLLPDLQAMKKATKHILLQALETGRVFVEIPQKHSPEGGAAQQWFLPRHCRVWAHMNSTPLWLRKVSSHSDIGQPAVDMASKKDITQCLADVFGMVYFVDTIADSHADYMAIHQTLLHAMNTPSIPLITQVDFKQLLEVARGIEVEFKPAAERLIQGYYVASRRVRTTGFNTWTPPVTAVTTLTSLSEAHAKLCLRSEVNVCDAVMAIYLYEESATQRSGVSVLNVRPAPHIKDNDIPAYIGPQRDVELQHFHQRLNHFIASQAADVSLRGWPEE